MEHNTASDKSTTEITLEDSLCVITMPNYHVVIISTSKSCHYLRPKSVVGYCCWELSYV
jgi:hypothetical protein